MGSWHGSRPFMTIAWSALSPAERLRADADRLVKAAEVLDPARPKRSGSERTAKAREALAAKRAAAKANGTGNQEALREGMRLALGTAGHTTAGDPDAREVADTLVHTTG